MCRGVTDRANGCLGSAYSLLALWRRGVGDVWLARAKMLGDSAAGAIRSHALRRDSLYKASSRSRHACLSSRATSSGSALEVRRVEQRRRIAPIDSLNRLGARKLVLRFRHRPAYPNTRPLEVFEHEDVAAGGRHRRDRRFARRRAGRGNPRFTKRVVRRAPKRSSLLPTAPDRVHLPPYRVR